MYDGLSHSSPAMNDEYKLHVLKRDNKKPKWAYTAHLGICDDPLHLVRTVSLKDKLFYTAEEMNNKRPKWDYIAQYSSFDKLYHL